MPKKQVCGELVGSKEDFHTLFNRFCCRPTNLQNSLLYLVHDKVNILCGRRTFYHVHRICCVLMHASFSCYSFLLIWIFISNFGCETFFRSIIWYHQTRFSIIGNLLVVTQHLCRRPNGVGFTFREENVQCSFKEKYDFTKLWKRKNEVNLSKFALIFSIPILLHDEQNFYLFILKINKELLSGSSVCDTFYKVTDRNSFRVVQSFCRINT